VIAVVNGDGTVEQYGVVARRRMDYDGKRNERRKGFREVIEMDVVGKPIEAFEVVVIPIDVWILLFG
jgi:hypothetical protein